LEEALSSVKASMTQCQNTLRAASQDGGIKKDHLLGSIKDMATGLGYVPSRNEKSPVDMVVFGCVLIL
jgi:hypothetical protein